MNKKMLDVFKSNNSYRELLNNILGGNRVNKIKLPKAAQLAVITALNSDLGKVILYITSSSDKLLSTMDEIYFWDSTAKTEVYQEPTPMFYEMASWDSKTRRNRLSTLSKLLSYHIPTWDMPDVPPIIFTSIKSLMYKTIPRRDFIKSSKRVHVGQDIKYEGFIESLVETGYSPEEMVVEPGQFSRRGGLIDIWVMNHDLPTRIDFFGDQIDSIRSFEPATQRTIKKYQSIQVSPAREILTSRFIKNVNEVEDIEEFYLSKIYQMPSSLIDYLPKDSLIILNNFELLEEKANDIEEQALKLRREMVKEEIITENFPVPYFSFSELIDSLDNYPIVDITLESTLDLIDFSDNILSGKKYTGNLDDLISDMKEYDRLDDRTVYCFPPGG